MQRRHEALREAYSCADHWFEDVALTELGGMKSRLDDSHHSVAYEIHAGYTIPLDLGPSRLQVLGAITYSDDPASRGETATSGRLVLGLTL